MSADGHAAYMDSAHAGRRAAEGSSHSIDLLANVADTLSQDDRNTFVGLGFTVVPRTPFVPLQIVAERLRHFGDAEGLLWRSGKPELYSSQLVDNDGMLVLVGGVMLLAAFDELIDLQNPLLSTNDSR